MHPRVTAIIVARNGADHLKRTLAALGAQTKKPDAVIAVDCGSQDDSGVLLAEFGPTQYVSSSQPLAFGEAVGHAVRVIAPASHENEWLWLLAQDSAPESGALAALLGAVEVAPSVAVAGPKQMEWNDSSHIREFGETITRLGSSVALVQNELDQAQHDVSSDVLGVGAGGMLVRRSLWDELNGFDPGLPVDDDALDFCIRTRLAGHRIVLVPEAKVTSAGAGVAGPAGSRSGWARRKRLRMRRRAQLHRRLVYAPAPALPVHWLSLVPLAILRSLMQLLRKQPGAIGGEFRAAFGAAFAGVRVMRSRRNIRRTAKSGWSAIAGLRMTFAEARRRNALERDAVRVRRDGEHRRVDFFSRGGGWTVLAMAVTGLALFAPLIGAQALGGGGLLPLSETPAQLWQHIGYGWRDLGLGFAGGADPFASVLAVLGSLTFWSPSFVLVLIFLTALPLAALGAWFLAARLTERSGLRAFAAILWALAPPLLVALSDGRPAAVLAHLILPWLFYAGFRARHSWSAAAATSLLAAATIACTPSLAPALLVVWLLCLLASGRRIARFIAIPLPGLALFAPLIWNQGIERNNWFALLADPGVVIAGQHTSAMQLVAGVPGDGLSGWSRLLASLGQDIPALVVVGVLLAPLAVLVLLALFLRGSLMAASALTVGLLGLATAVFADAILVSFAGSQPVPVWPGAGLSLLWLGAIAAAATALGGLGRFSPIPAAVALVAAIVALAPLALVVPTGFSSVAGTTGRTLPAVVAAEALGSPRLGTLVLTAQPDGGLAVRLERGAGETLDEQSTLANTATALTAEDARLARLGVNLASQSAFDAADELADLGIGFVMLEPAEKNPESLTKGAGVDAATGAARDAENDVMARASLALDGNSLLTPVGATDYGMLWSHQPPEGAASPEGAIPAAGTTRSIVLLGQGIVIGLMLLLAVPTGAVRDRDSRSINPKPRHRPTSKRRVRKQERSAPGRALDADGMDADGMDADRVGADGVGADWYEQDVAISDRVEGSIRVR